MISRILLCDFEYILTNIKKKHQALSKINYFDFSNLTPHSIPSIPDRYVLIVPSIEFLYIAPAALANFRSFVASMTISNELPSICVVPINC